jgi:Xaa-Pro dipeptidase
MFKELTIEEIGGRLHRFIQAMNKNHPGWDTAFIVSKINQYYFTGTMQDGLLLIKRNGQAYYFVRRSYERALDESPFPAIFPMQSYRDATEIAGTDCKRTYIETEIVTYALLERLRKYFDLGRIGSLDKTILSVRAIKSPYELRMIEEAGKRHSELLYNIVPSLLREGISEAYFAAELFERMVKYGHHGVARFQMFQTEMGIGQIGFGESALYPTYFDGPGGALGMHPAVPLFGNRDRKLKKGDLVFVDIGFGVNGYNSDKTQVYIFGAKPSQEVLREHRTCIEIERRTAEMLKPGAVPSDIYDTVMGELSGEFKRNFMGYGARQVKFLGHSIGLHIDEIPVIANGFDDPLEENMVLAVEPKKGMEGLGLVGVEDTYIVTPEGGRCVTGGGCDIIEV